MISDNEIVLWAQLAESTGGVVGLSSYVLFEKISKAASDDTTVFSRLKTAMQKKTRMNDSQIRTFTEAAEQYHSRYGS